MDSTVYCNTNNPKKLRMSEERREELTGGSRKT
jgi:hypothetical protein